jgi:predicted phosphoribosyltransferase
MHKPFENRREAGQVLADQLREYADKPDVIVLALPRGGVPIAYEVAQALHAPLDIWVVRKLGVPGHEELAMGATASGGVRVLNHDIVREFDISREVIDAVTREEQREIERRELAYRANLPKPFIEGKIVLLVDDGLATGATMRAALESLRQRNPAKVVVAVPAADPEVCAEFRAEADAVICAITPQPFRAVGYWYRDFSQTSDEEVRDLLQLHRRTHEVE